MTILQCMKIEKAIRKFVDEHDCLDFHVCCMNGQDVPEALTAMIVKALENND